ncbi:MAG: hypothetical protein MZW92_27040 [Comamonadaceae bacterium]|nr:hypothetical protein [Comamonadaceae bacterium]
MDSIAQNKFDDAKKRLEASVTADPRNHLALLALADLSQRREAPVEDTKALYQRAVQAAPDLAGAAGQADRVLDPQAAFQGHPGRRPGGRRGAAPGPHDARHGRTGPDGRRRYRAGHQQLPAAGCR